MNAETTYFHCGDQLKKTLAPEIKEVESVVAGVKWSASFQHSQGESGYEHQTGYNKAFANQFGQLGWELQPTLRTEPRLIGDFRKGLAAR